MLRRNFDQHVFSLDIFHGRLEPCFRPRLLSAVSKDSKKSGLVKNVAFAAHVDFLLFIRGIEDSAGYVVRYKLARRLELRVHKSIGEHSLGTNLLPRRGFPLYQNGPRVRLRRLPSSHYPCGTSSDNSYIIRFQRSIFPKTLTQALSIVGSIGCWAARPASISICFPDGIATGAFTPLSTVVVVRFRLSVSTSTR